MLEYSIVIPAYNEEKRITNSLTKVVNFMTDYSDSYEIIVVDDGSSDSTTSLVENYAKDHSQIKLIKNPHKGKGYTVRTGMLEAQGSYVLMSDADMATPIEEIKRLKVWLTDHDFDVVIASREGIGAKRSDEPFFRHLMGRVFNWIIQILLLPGIQDTQCGFKMMKKSVAHDIFNALVLFGKDAPDVNVPRVTAFDVEMLVVAKKHGYKIKEVPVNWIYGTDTKVSPIRDSINNLVDVLKVKLNDIKGKYKVSA